MSVVKGSFTILNGKPYYKIDHAEEMQPFFIQVASCCDIWMFLSSKGGITAGRINADGAVFPYETDDKLHNSTSAGSKTVVRIGNKYWEPFLNNAAVVPTIKRAIYKSNYGNSVMFEEINEELRLSYSYTYESSEKYGIVKTSSFKNLSDKEIEIEFMDGFQNIMPNGVNGTLQANTSTLADAYKSNELMQEGLGIYSLTTLINDSPNPIEMLRANVAWTTCDGEVFLNAEAMSAFCRGQDFLGEKSSYGCRGVFFVRKKVRIAAKASFTFSSVVDCGYAHCEIEVLRKFLKRRNFEDLFLDIELGTSQLLKIVAMADGVQHTGDEEAVAHHYLNTLYNIMRGGTFENIYEFDKNDFYQFVYVRNRTLADDKIFFDGLSNCKTIHELKRFASHNTDMLRLVLEYIPLSFSRRHGDPSRPWNKFIIRVKDENGKKINNYEGNWRDIFQNWEALGLSFPCYYENMVAKFVNASTVDGFNPYRISRDGIDWEKPEPENPFSGIGYWGDHQVIYLLRLLKALEAHFPKRLNDLLTLEIFSYANVPYEIKPYEDILKNSKNTILYIEEKNAEIEKYCETYGSDGRLLLKDDKVYCVTLIEKLIVPLLSKISNLLPGGGIWMNTQRPEWNDANNAIVGIGLSMVTVYHLGSYLAFLTHLLSDMEQEILISNEVADWVVSVTTILTEQQPIELQNEKEILNLLGMAFSDYRKKVYAAGFSGKIKFNTSYLKQLISLCTNVVNYTIEKNKGEIYATYNLLYKDFSTYFMRPMLEGQVAVIGSGSLDGSSVCHLLNNMKEMLYIPELRAYALYPPQKTTSFLLKNVINTALPEVENVTARDISGTLHFAPHIVDGESLKIALLKSGCNAAIQKSLEEEYERVFKHSSFSGRSEVMYKFEGIGCIYWHQNAKLALAVLETAREERKRGKDATEIYKQYKEITDGFIYRKTPSECGAIPVEPYSHTSYNKKSEQPGMTGQVKESIITRRGELGVWIQDGSINFDPWFLSQREFTQAGKLEFTICGCNVCYTRANRNEVTLNFSDGTKKTMPTFNIPQIHSREIFERSGRITEINVFFDTIMLNT